MDAVALVGRLLVSLSVVLGLMWLLARRANKGGRLKSTKLMDVLARQQLSRTASVAVVRVLDQALIVGITDGQVSVLGETDLAAVEKQLAEQAAAKPAAKTAAKAGAKSALTAGATPARTTPRSTTVRPAPAGRAHDDEAPRKALAGSALSPDTWRQTLESLRELTVRTR